jgi:hypothetical protein
MAQRIEVVAFEVKKVVSKKEASKGQEFTIPEAQCILHGENGERRVGVLNLPKDHPTVKPGFYRPTFKITAGFDGKLFAGIDTLIPESVKA